MIRKLAQEGAAHGILSHEIAASITSVSGVPQKGTRLGAWLTIEQAQALLRAPAGDTPRARRDRALVALLIGCGLRRTEVAELEIKQIRQEEGRWIVRGVKGKGSRMRNVPMPAWAKSAVDAWTSSAGIRSGRLFRSLSQTGEVGDGLTGQSVYLIVKGYAEQLGIEIAPHDLHRTFAKLAHRGQSPLEQIQLSLGHDSVSTTERYLGVRQDLRDAPCDRLGIEFDRKG